MTFKRIKNINCDCNIKAFMITDISNCKYIYRCSKPAHVLNGKNLKNMVPSKSKPCDFYKEIQFAKPEKPIEKEKKVIVKLKTNKYDYLDKKVNFFIEKKYYITFQEIEIMCKELNIEKFDHTQETMYEFCCRIKNTIKPKIPNSSWPLQADQQYTHHK